MTRSPLSTFSPLVPLLFLITGCPLPQPLPEPDPDPTPAVGDDDDDDDDSSPGDTEGPSVRSSVPSANQLGVSPSVLLEIELSEAVTAESAAAINLEGPAGFVAGDVWVDGAFILLEPAQALVSAGSYTLRLRADGVFDLAGNAMEESVAIAFTTADVEGPSLVGADPYDGEDQVEVDRTITLTFSESLDPASVSTSSVKVFPSRKVDGVDYSTTGLPGSVSSSGNQITFTPDRGRLSEFNTNYLVVADVADGAGNSVLVETGFETLQVDPAYWYRIQNAQFYTKLDTYSNTYQTFLSSGDASGTYWRFTEAFGALQLRNSYGGDDLYLEGATPGGNSLINGGGYFTGQHWTLTERYWGGAIATNESPINYNITSDAGGPNLSLGVFGDSQVGLEQVGWLDQEWYLVNAGPR